MSQMNGKDIKPNSSSQSRIQDYITEYKIEKSDSNNENTNTTNTNNNNYNNNNNTININNTNQVMNNNGSYYNYIASPKYHLDKLPDISIKETDPNTQNDIERIRQIQRSSGSLYRHNNDQLSLLNPYISKPNRSYFQKTLPQAVLLQQTRQERIVVQEQNQILINRLRKLRQEEVVLIKSAEDTTKRAEKVFQQKKFYLKKKEEEQQRMQQQDDVAYTHPRKQLEMLRVQIAREEKLKEKKQGFLQVKKTIAEEQIRKAQEEKVQVENIKFKMEQMKKQKEASKLKKDQYLIEKRQKIEKDIQKQRMKEEALLSFVKFEAKDFEKREQEMLERIRQTQLVKEQAKEQLKDSVTLDMLEYESRYLKEKKTNNSHNLSVQSLKAHSQQNNSHSNNNNKHNKNNTQIGVGTNYNSKQISDQTLKIDSNGQSYISNGNS